MLELSSGVAVNDGRWHDIRAHFSPTYLEISADAATAKSLRPSSSGGYASALDLSGALFFGGVESGPRRTRALAQGVAAAASSLQGCLLDLQLDGRRIGLPDVVETRDVRADCVWIFPCLETDQACGREDICQDKGSGHLQCECQSKCKENPGEKKPPKKEVEKVRAQRLLRPSLIVASQISRFRTLS